MTDGSGLYRVPTELEHEVRCWDEAGEAGPRVRLQGFRLDHKLWNPVGPALSLTPAAASRLGALLLALAHGQRTDGAPDVQAAP
jgi:hypothetical protein